MQIFLGLIMNSSSVEKNSVESAEYSLQPKNLSNLFVVVCRISFCHIFLSEFVLMSLV